MIGPQDFSSSYARLVLRDFRDDENVAEFTIRNVVGEVPKSLQGTFDVMTNINIARDSMDEDENLVIPTNFTAVGCILLEFTDFLSQKMVRFSKFYSHFNLMDALTKHLFVWV